MRMPRSIPLHHQPPHYYYHDDTIRSYKGSNIALMVELLGGALAGGDVEDKWARGNWGNLVLAIDPEIVGPPDVFKARVAAVLARVKGATCLPGAAGPSLPGERSEARAEEVAATGKIKLERNLYEGLLAEFAKTGGTLS